MPDSPLLYLTAVAVVFAIAAWAGWAIAGRRAPKPSVLPNRVWLCEGCHSFNDPTHVTCYRCHRPRPIDARYIEPDPDFHVDQQLGRPKGSTQLGASETPWLAGEEPLRDAWLAERARASEPVPEGGAPAPEEIQPAPAFWTNAEQSADAAAEPPSSPSPEASPDPSSEPAAEASPDPSPEPPVEPPEREPPTGPG